MATIKSSNALLAEFRTFLRAYNRALDTSDSSIAKDLLLVPYSVGSNILMKQVGEVRNLHILSQCTGADIDRFGSDYGLERSQGEYAAVTLTFYTTVLPTSEIVIPAGTQAATRGSSFVETVTFSTISESRFSVAALPAYYSYDRGRYEFSVSAQADAVGESGNVGANLIVDLTASVSQIQGVTNLNASSGGSGIESDEDFKKRILNIMTGRDLNTINGLQSYVQSTGIIDAYGVRVEDADSERSSGVDVFIITPYTETVTDTFTYYPSTPRYYFTYAPVISVTSVVGASVGTVSSTNYDAVIDNSTPLRRSYYAQDYIEIRSGASMSPGETFTVTYTYSNEVHTLQEQLEQDSNKILTANPYVKRAYPLYLYLNATITLTANADGPSTRNRCRNALIQYMSEYRLGDDIQKSDIIIVLQQGYGDFPVSTVDAVVISSYYLQDEFGTTYNPTDEVISVTDKQYVTYGRAVII